MTYRLALPCLAIWLVIQRDLLRPAAARGSRQPPVESDELSVEVDLDVALQRG